MSGPSKNFQPINNANEKTPKRSLVASSSGRVQHKVLKHMVSPKSLSLRKGPTGQLVFFLLKVAALEAIRRLSRARCPSVWRVIQSLPVLCYPPFKWIQGWEPLRILVTGLQNFSRPLLFLSIATAISDHSEDCQKAPDGMDDSELQSVPPPSTPDMRNCEETPVSIASENWFLKLLEELDKQGIALPERLNEDELRRFYSAANGDFSCLLSSVKRTVRWRKTYHILSIQELEMWSHLVFWHGLDVKLRPCLVVRLGVACSSLMPSDRPCFAQAVVSQIEYGVLHLINEKDPYITVLMDCQGLSPFKFPMQMLRSCSTLVQEHYPDRLGTLFVIRLPPVVRVIAQTFIQEIPAAAKFRERGLLFVEEMDVVFGDVVATGAEAYTPSSGVLPDLGGGTSHGLEEEAFDLDISDESDAMRTETFTAFNQSYSHLGSPMESPMGTPMWTSSEPQAEEGRPKVVRGKKRSEFTARAGSSKKKQSPIQVVSSSLNNLATVFESVKMKKFENDEKYSAKRCVDIIKELPIENGSKMYFDCIKLVVGNKDVRRFLVDTEDPQDQLGLLKSMLPDN